MKRFLWCALILTAIVTIAWPMIPVPSAEGRLAAIAKPNPEFQSRPLELSAQDKEFLGKANATQHLIAMRNGGRFILTVIDGSNNRHAVHDPSYCFSGAGWKAIGKKSVKLNSGEATWVSLAKGKDTAEAIWFFDNGEKQFTSPFEYWLETSSRRITLGKSGGEPLLVSLRGFPGEPVNWDRARQILLPALGFR